MWLLLSIDDILRELTQTKSLVGVLLLLSALFFYKVYDIVAKKKNPDSSKGAAQQSDDEREKAIQEDLSSGPAAGSTDLKALIADGHADIALQQVTKMLKEKKDPIHKKLYKNALLLSNKLFLANIMVWKDPEPDMVHLEGSSKVYLLKDGQVIGQINENTIKNYEQLVNALVLEYLGEKEETFAIIKQQHGFVLLALLMVVVLALFAWLVY